MIIRAAKKADLPIVFELNEESVPHVGKIGMDDLVWYFENSRKFWVVEEKGVIHAFMIVFGPGSDYKSLNYRFFDAHYSDFVYVDRLAVAAGQRRNGLGKKLYSRLEEKTKAPYITCEVNLLPENPISFNFHTNLGFKEIAKLSTHSGDNMVSLLVKQLDK